MLRHKVQCEIEGCILWLMPFSCLAPYVAFSSGFVGRMFLSALPHAIEVIPNVHCSSQSRPSRLQALDQLSLHDSFVYGPQHDKTNKMTVRPARTQISLGIRPV